eukprot:TRINITY_DN7680_c0_g1_i2.p1 TRINITY_DN7680_c0_g1~~TRINITY_DN7680_c0_g1_i2.p1  ORF type:complete len:339 (-),score=83.82 TRINITY_DN7680_c0_g1_i2:9-1025(-)
MPLPDNVLLVLNIVLNQCLITIEGDLEKPTVCTACEVVSQISKHVGPSGIHTFLEKLGNGLFKIYSKKAACQSVRDEYDEEDEEDYNLTLLDTATMSLVDMAKALGSLVEPVFQKCLPPLLKYYKSNNPASYRSTIIGTIAEVANEIEFSIHPYVKQILPAAIVGLEDVDPQLQRNSAYCCGILCQFGGNEAASHYEQILSKLRPLFEKNAPADVRDNASGATARMIITNPQLVPLNIVLPVLLSALPTTSDFEPNRPIFRSILMLFQANNQAIFPHLPQIISIFGQVLGKPEVETEIQTDMVFLLKNLVKQFPNQMLQTINSLPSEIQANLNLHLSK